MSVTTEDLYALYHRQIFKRVLCLVCNKEDAEDICQETWLRAHKALPRLEHGSNLFAWIYTIATHIVYDRGRQYQLRQSLAAISSLDTEDAPDMVDMRTDFDVLVAEKDLVNRALARLPEAHRQALATRAFGYSKDYKATQRSRTMLRRAYARLEGVG